MASGHTIRPGLLRREHGPMSIGLVAIIVGCLAGLLVLDISSPAKLAAVLLGAAVVAAMGARPEFGLAVLSFVTYSGIPDVLSRTQGLPSLIWPMIGILLMAAFLRRILTTSHAAKPIPVRALFLISIYVGICILSLAWTRDPDRTSLAIFNLLQSALIAATLMILLESGNGIRLVCWALLGASMFLGTLSVHQYLTGNFQSEYWGFARAEFRQIAGSVHAYRVTGPLGDANFFSQIMLVTIPVAAERFLHETKKLLRIAALYSLAVASLCVVFAYSRGAFVAILLVAGVVALRFRIRIAHWIAILMAVALLALFIPNEYMLRIHSLINVARGKPGPTDRAITGRMTEVLAAWEMFLDHPVLGVGLGNYPVYYQQYSRQVGIDPTLSDRSAHSMYLQIAAETGLSGLVLIGILIWMVLRGLRMSTETFKALKEPQLASLVAAFHIGMIAYFAAAIFLHVAYPRFLWMLVGFALGISFVARNAARQSQSEGIAHG